MSEELQYRVFSLSSADIFPKGDLPFAMKWLKEKGNKLYYFQKMKPKNLRVGSIVLFSFESHIFGQARTSTLVEKLSQEDQKRLSEETGYSYTGTVRFDPDSIQVFKKKQPLKKDVTKSLKIVFTRNFTKLTKEHYEAIVELAGGSPY